MLSMRHIANAIGSTWRLLTGETDAARAAIARTFEDNFDGLAVIGEDGRVLAASRVASALLLGNDTDTIVGRSAYDVLPQPMMTAVQQAFADGRRGVATPMAPARIGDPRAGGYIVRYVVNLSEMEQRGSLLPRRVVHMTFWDDTERRLRDEELTFMGTHDHLTGALTRAELSRIINAALAGDRRRAGGLTMLAVGLDRFKVVNDTLGRAFGDMVLKNAVSRIKAAGMETVARLDGEVFAMIRYGRMSAEEAESICQNLIERVILPYSQGIHRTTIGASIGLTHTDVSGFEPDMLLSHALVALAEARARPGNDFVVFTHEMQEALRSRQAIDGALRQALSACQLSVTYQPQVALESGDLVGVEALIRWRHPEYGMVSPERFVAAAEENGEIIEIGRWVLQQACREVANWPFETRLAVNVSPVQFEFADMVTEVRSALAESGLPPHRLDIEITEGMFVSKAEHVLKTLDKLRELGVGIALDDFGTGYSSLGYLSRLPVDKIKIDQSFVQSLPASVEAGAIIRAVMTLSETLNKVVIAEGVETADQAWMLRMMGCRIGQGYHFGRPRSGDEMAAWFDAHEGFARSLAS